MRNKERHPKADIINILAVICSCLQPIFWYFIWSLFEDPKDTDVGLVLVCIVSCIGFVIGSIWTAGYLVKGENPWED